MYKKAKITFKNIICIQLFILFCITLIVLIGKVCLIDTQTVGAINKSSNDTIWDGKNTLVDGNYYLTEDIYLTEKVTIESGKEVTLALNGYAIIRENDSACIEVQEGAKLSIKSTPSNIESSNTGEADANTILDDTNSTEPFLVLKNAECNLLEKINFCAALRAKQSSIEADEVTFTKEVELINHSKATLLAPKIENKLTVLNGSEITLLSKSRKESIDFGTASIINLQSSKFICDNSKVTTKIKIPHIQMTGDNNELNLNKCTIEDLEFKNINKSNITIINSTFNLFESLIFEGKENYYYFDIVNFVSDVQFKGDENSFIFQDISTKLACTIEANTINTFSYTGKTINLDLQKVQKIQTFIYKNACLVPQSNNLTIVDFIISASNVEIQGKEIDKIDFSNIKIQNLTVTAETTAVFNENSLLTDTKLFFLSNTDTTISSGRVVINYKMENEIALGAGVKLDFGDNGSIENVKFTEGTNVDDYQDLIDKGYIKLPQSTQSPDSIQIGNATNNSIRIIVILIVSMIVDLLIVWFIIIFTFKRNKK